MGFFGRLFGSKKKEKSAPSSGRQRGCFTTRYSNSGKRRSYSPPPTRAFVEEGNGLDAGKHAIAVAAATAAVAEAAVAAAHAAAEVVRLTSGNGRRNNREWTQKYIAAVNIQSAFRGYLARRALRALKALVKLQALVRGHIVRKQTKDMLRRMQTLVRLQAQARARSSHSSTSFHSSTALLFPSSSSSPRSLHTRCISNSELNNRGSKRLEVEEDDKILEVDTWKPRKQSLLGLRSTENSPQLRSSGSRRRTPFTPTSSEYSWGSNNYYYSGHHANYMSNTESYKAKARSQSAPKQRLDVSNETSSYKRSDKEECYYYTEVVEESSDLGTADYYGGISERLNRNQSEKSRMNSTFLA